MVAAVIMCVMRANDGLDWTLAKTTITASFARTRPLNVAYVGDHCLVHCMVTMFIISWENLNAPNEESLHCIARCCLNPFYLINNNLFSSSGYIFHTIPILLIF